MTGVQRVAAEERLFSLVLALLASDAGLTKTEILGSVQGYRQLFTPNGNPQNLERQFERDKDDIRELGIPLETVDDPADPGNNQKLRYRIPRGEYDLPADISFTPSEITLLNLAGMVWREGSLSSGSRTALLKLRSLGVAADEPVLGYAPRARVRDAAFEPLSTALDRSAPVRFAYLKPGEADAREREVLPLALVQWQGRWLLYAQEPDTGARKSFLLSRITSAVRVLPATRPRPEGDLAAEALASLSEVWARNVAELVVEAGSDAATRLAKRPGASSEGDGLRLHFSDLPLLADELAGYGPEVLVRAPEELRDAVADRLNRVAAAHGAATEPR